MPIFAASRWTSGNSLFPTRLEVNDTFVVKRTRGFFSSAEESIHLQRVSSIRVTAGPLFADVVIESAGGTDPIAVHGLRKGDAYEAKRLVEAAQARLGGAAEATRACPFCAETIKAAATICRFCNREIPR